jgi:hypothetical protein
MKLTVFNGSPRGGKSNTKVLLEHFLNGYESDPGNTYELFYLNRLNQTERFVDAFANAKVVLLAHPLYTDAMPGMVKGFIEELEPLCGREDNPDLGFIVQSGFGEAAHSRFVERYHKKLAKRLGCRYLGTVIKPNCEPIQVYVKQFQKVFEEFTQLGKAFGETGEFDDQMVRQMAKPEKFSIAMRLMFQFFWTIQIKYGTGYWDEKLKENEAYDKRFDRPYIE